MICPYCWKGRVVTKMGEVNQIHGICDQCGGTGIAHCCDGAGENYSGEQKAATMVQIAEDTILIGEVNPNDNGC